MALPTRLTITWRRRLASPKTISGTPGRIAADQLQPLAVGPRGERFQRVAEAFVEIEQRAVQVEPAGLDPGEVQHVADQGEEGFPGVADHGQVLALFGGEGGVEDQFGHAEDGVQRGADLVAHAGQEGALGPVGGLGGRFGLFAVFFGGFLGGDVPEDDLRADDVSGGVADGGLHDVDVADLAVLLVLLGILEDLPRFGDPAVVAAVFLGQIGRIEVEIAFSEDLFGGLSQQLAERPVGKGELAAEVLAEDLHGKVFHQRRVQGFRVLQDGLGPPPFGDLLGETAVDPLELVGPVDDDLLNPRGVTRQRANVQEQEPRDRHPDDQCGQGEPAAACGEVFLGGGKGDPPRSPTDGKIVFVSQLAECLGEGIGRGIERGPAARRRPSRQENPLPRWRLVDYPDVETDDRHAAQGAAEDPGQIDLLDEDPLDTLFTLVRRCGGGPLAVDGRHKQQRRRRRRVWCGRCGEISPAGPRHGGLPGQQSPLDGFQPRRLRRQIQAEGQQVRLGRFEQFDRPVRFGRPRRSQRLPGIPVENSRRVFRLFPELLSVLRPVRRGNGAGHR